MSHFIQETFDAGLQAFEKEGIQTITALKDQLVNSRHAQTPAIERRYNDVIARCIGLFKCLLSLSLLFFCDLCVRACRNSDAYLVRAEEHCRTSTLVLELSIIYKLEKQIAGYSTGIPTESSMHKELDLINAANFPQLEWVPVSIEGWGR